MSYLLSRMSELMYSYRRSLAGLLILGLLVQGLGLVIPRATQYTLDVILPSRNSTQLILAMVVLVFVVIVQQALAVIRRMSLVHWSLQFDQATWREYVDHLFSVSSLWHREQRTGDLVARLADHEPVRHFIMGALTRIIVDAGMVVIYALILFTYDLILGAVVLGGLGLVAYHAWWAGARIRQAHTEQLKSKARQEAYLHTALLGMEMIQATGLQSTVTQEWSRHLDTYIAANESTQRKRQLLESLGSILQSTMSLAILGYGAALVIRGDLTIGSLIAVQLYAAQALLPAQSLLIGWDEWQRARAAVERIDQIYAIPNSKREKGIRPETPLQGEIRFVNVSYQYPHAGNKTIHQLNWTLPSGCSVAIWGPSGKGKTTLLRLILGLIAPQEGSIMIDGHELHYLDLAWYRQQVGVVFQDSSFLGSTVAEVVAWGDSSPNAAQVEDALRLSGLDEWRRQNHLSLESPITDFGGNLSAGQRQRLALARCLYRQPRLLILDEPTANLDQKTEQELKAVLATCIPGKSTILVTHRSELLALVDYVLDLENGKFQPSCDFHVNNV